MAIPAAVHVDVQDADLAAMRADFRRRHFGLANPWTFAVGVLSLLLGIARIHGARSMLDLWPLLAGIVFIALAWKPDPDVPSVLRPTEARFSDEGLDIDVASTTPANRRYTWRQLRRIDDTGDILVIIPKSGPRLVLPKRAFPDGGLEAEDSSPTIWLLKGS